MLRRQQFALLRLARGRAMSSAPMTVAVLPGDGIGPEVMDVAVKVLEHAGGLFGKSFKSSLTLDADLDQTDMPNHVKFAAPAGCALIFDVRDRIASSRSRAHCA